MAYQPTTNFGWAMPRGGDQAQISVINQQFTAKADEIVYQTRRMIAPGYIDDGTKTYHEGDIVEFENVDYVCTGTTSGAWDSSKWDATDMATQIQEAKESGGTNVEANPVEAATADLHKLKVDTTVYGIPDPTVTKTATGNPIEFSDGADAPLVKCVTQIQGYQSGTGTPSSDNIRPIVAYTEGEIEVGGIVPFTDAITSGYTIGSDGIIGLNSERCATLNGISVEENTTYELSYDGNIRNGVFFYNTSDVFISYLAWDNQPRRFTTPANTKKVRFSFEAASGITNTVLVGFTTHTTTYPSAIYRGSEDVVKGEVTTKWGMIASYAGETLPGEWISDRDEYAPGTTPTTGAQVAYALATPTTAPVAVSNAPIKSLAGYSHIESTTGEMDVEYITQTYQPLVDLIDEAADTKNAYSTTEHVVGKWIDGSDVYERTVHLDSLSSSPLDWETLFQESVGVIVSVTGCFLRTTGELCDIGSTSFRVCYNPAIHRGYVCYYYTEGNISEFTITVRYTKTSSNNRSLSKGATDGLKADLSEVKGEGEESVDKVDKVDEPTETIEEKEENAGESNSENER